MPEIAQESQLPISAIMASMCKMRLSGSDETFQCLTGMNGRRYRIVRTIRKALQGKVVLAQELEHCRRSKSFRPSTLVAIKVLSKACMAAGVTLDGVPVKEDGRREVEVLRYLSTPGHANVLRVHGVYEDAQSLYVVLDYLAGGELCDLVVPGDNGERRCVSESTARQYVWDIVQATLYVHGRGLVHRDISLENVLLERSPQRDTPVARLIDFGLAVRSPGTGRLLCPDAAVGKTSYMAPEVYANVPHDPEKSDAWCIGVCLFALLFGSYPYTRPSERECACLASMACGGLRALMDSWGYSARVSPEAVDLLDRVLCVDPQARLSVEDMATHPFFNGM